MPCVFIPIRTLTTEHVRTGRSWSCTKIHWHVPMHCACCSQRGASATLARLYDAHCASRTRHGHYIHGGGAGYGAIWMSLRTIFAWSSVVEPNSNTGTSRLHVCSMDGHQMTLLTLLLLLVRSLHASWRGTYIRTHTKRNAK